jgi:redox-sensing transcriptional repressor
MRRAVRRKGGTSIQLIDTLESFLGYRDSTTAVVIGTGHLGGALLNYPNFQEMGLSILAGFDVDPNKIGTTIGGKEIFALDKLPNLLPRLNAHIVIVTVPAQVAQNVVDIAVESGALAVWNFAPTHINVPDNVVIENVNLASSLAVLSHRLNSELLTKEQ